VILLASLIVTIVPTLILLTRGWEVILTAIREVSFSYALHLSRLEDREMNQEHSVYTAARRLGTE
jgi:hypothetical protein